MKKLGIVMLLLAGLASAAARPPNVIMFAVDDMNDWIGPMGQRQAVTPNLDRLAAMGMTFHNAHAAASFCAPSRSALFTGRFAPSTGCHSTQVFFHDHPDIKPLQSVFKDGGYATYGGGKLFHHPAGYVDLRGWDEFFVRSPEQRKRGWPLDSWTVDDPILPEPYPNSIFNRDREPADQFFMECAIINSEWRYIRYANGSEELYDVRKDSHEWQNLAARPDLTKIKEKLRLSAPSSFAKPGPEVHELRLVTEDERFHWKRKPTRDSKPEKPARRR